jgi:hypothetical protein
MTILDFQIAARSGAPLIIGCVGVSGGGKTRSALELARGIAGENGRVCLIDTESGRAKLQSKVCAPWWHAELTPPFSPDRYMQAVADAQQAKFDIIIVDSCSHEWAGIGGCLEMVDASTLKNEHARWARPKALHKKFVNQLLVSRIPIILCLRAQEKTRQTTDPATGKKIIVSDGLQPIQEKGFPFEMTVSLLFQNGGYPAIIKGDDEINQFFPPDQKVSVETGRRLAGWVNEIADVDVVFENLKRQGEEVAGVGTAFFRDWWNSAPVKPYRERLKPHLENFKSIAAEADELANQPKDLSSASDNLP